MVSLSAGQIFIDWSAQILIRIDSDDCDDDGQWKGRFGRCLLSANIAKRITFCWVSPINESTWKNLLKRINRRKIMSWPQITFKKQALFPSKVFINKLASPKATLVWNYDLTQLLALTSIAKNWIRRKAEKTWQTRNRTNRSKFCAKLSEKLEVQVESGQSVWTGIGLCSPEQFSK